MTNISQYMLVGSKRTRGCLDVETDCSVSGEVDHARENDGLMCMNGRARRMWLLSVSTVSMFCLVGVFWVLLRPAMPAEDPYKNLQFVNHARQIPFHNMPLYYKLRLRFYLSIQEKIFGDREDSFHGDVYVHMRVDHSSNHIVLHAHRLQILNLTIMDDSGLYLPHKFAVIENWNVLNIETEKYLDVGRNYTVHILYYGFMQNGGIYISEYTHEEKKRRMLTTHLQPADAKSVFPCLDNPEAKAVFEAIIEHPKGTHAVSNTMEVETTEQSADNQFSLTRFEPTPIMSTYLFAICISEFPFVEAKHNDVRIRVYVEPNKIRDTDAALATIPRLLKFYEDYFDIPYPLKKLDVYLVSVSRVPAMENWGLIVCSQKFVIYNASITNPVEVTRMVNLLGHEIAHQWFGNIVTMKWWNNLWLNEGFAVMMGRKAVSNITGKEDLTMHENALGYRLDQTQTVPPVSIRPNEMVNLQALFTLVVYKKAAAVLQMVEAIVGVEVFQKGVRMFLKKYAYSNADHEDLMASLSEAHKEMEGDAVIGTNFSLTQVMESWIFHTGFPLVIVKSTPTPGTVIVTQRKYTERGESSPEQWKIALVRDSSRHWLLENSSTTINMGNDVVLDREGKLWARILYDDQLYENITQTLFNDADTIPVAARTRLIDDIFNFAEFGYVSYGVMFRLLFYFRSEVAFHPYQLLLAHLDLLKNKLHPRSNNQAHLITEFSRAILSPLYDNVMSNNPLNSTYGLTHGELHEFVSTRMVHYGHQKCTDDHLKMFPAVREACRDSLLSNSSCNTIPTYMRNPVYLAVGRNGSDEDLEFLYSKWRDEQYQVERDRIFSGMAGSKNESFIHRIFYDALFTYHLRGEQLLAKCREYSRYNLDDNYYRTFVTSHLNEIAEKYRNKNRITMDIMRCYSTGLPSSKYDEYFHLCKSLGVEKDAPAAHKTFIAYEKWANEFHDIIIKNLTEVMQSPLYKVFST